jgi:hypothetical protein
MSLQQIIDTAVNVEVNRSKLVAQTISRSGRISVASRNWANPFRFVITPKPVWSASEYRSVFSSLLENDKYLPHGFYLNNVDATTFQADLGNSWMVNYQGDGDENTNIFTKTFVSGGAPGAFTVTLSNATSLTTGMRIIGTGITGFSTITNIAGSVITIADAFTTQAAGSYTGYNLGKDNVLDSYQASSETSGAMLCLSNRNSLLVTPGTYIARQGDYLRVANFRYPYVATADVVVPTTATSISGVVQPAGVTVFLEPSVSGVFPGNNLTFVSTTTRTSVTGITSTAGLSVGQILTKTSGTGVFGGLTYIAEIPSPTTIVIQSTTACTSGSIVFDGTGPTSTPTVCVPIHRGFIGTISTNTNLLLGARGAQFVVNVAALPQIRYLPGQLVELTGDIELVEEIL